MEKLIMFVLTHSANFNPRGIFVGRSDHFKDECFQRAVHAEGSQRSIIPLSIPTIWKKSPEKTRRMVPNLNAVEVIVCFFFQRIHHCAKLIFSQRILKFILLMKNPFSSAVC